MPRCKVLGDYSSATDRSGVWGCQTPAPPSRSRRAWEKLPGNSEPSPQDVNSVLFFTGLEISSVLQVLLPRYPRTSVGLAALSMCPTCGQEPGVKSRSSQGSEVRTSKPGDRWSWSSSNGPPTRQAGLPLRSSRHRTASQSVQTAARLPAGRRPAARGPVDATSENTRERRTKGGGSSETRSVPPVPPTPEVCKGSPRRRGLPAPGSSRCPLIHPHPHPALLHPLPTPSLPAAAGAPRLQPQAAPPPLPPGHSNARSPGLSPQALPKALP